MMTFLATLKVRRLPAALLVPCLLLMGVLVVPAPDTDGETDGMRAHGSTHAQVVRAPQLRATTSGGHAPVAVLVAGVVLPQERVTRDAGGFASPVVEPRSEPRLSPPSRAPPASS